MAHQHIDRQAAMAARRAVLKSSGRFWHPSDLKMPDSTAQHVLAALVETGELRHVRRGLYWRGTKTPLGMSPPPQEALVAELAPGRGVGPAGLSAANALRLSTQVPRRAEYAVPRRAPADVGSLKFVSRAARKGRTKSRLNQTEVAALEVLDAWQRVIEVSPNDAMRRLEDLVRQGAIRADKLARAASTESGATQTRLKTLLERTGNDAWAAKVPTAQKKAPTNRAKKNAVTRHGKSKPASLAAR